LPYRAFFYKKQGNPARLARQDFLLNPNKIIIRGTNWIGDAVMTLPAIAAIRSLFPDSQLDVLARNWSSPVYKYSKHTDNIIEFERPKGLPTFAIISRIAKKIRGNGYELAIAFPNSFESALIFKIAGIPKTYGYNTDFRSVILSRAVDLPGYKGTKHEVFYYLNLVEKVFGKKWKEGSLAPEPVLHIPQDEQNRARGLLKKNGWNGKSRLLGLNPGAAFGPAKCWPAEKYRELAVALTQTFPDSTIVVFGTEREREAGEEICVPLGKRAINLCGRTALDEAICTISVLDLMVSNDSGLMHVAAACQVPLVALFGSTNPVTTGPFSKQARVIKHELPCSPCLSRECPRDFICMLGITVSEVLDACQEMVK